VDNIFEILIYLFIIISFVSSFFRKKKKAMIKKEQMQAQIPDQQRIEEDVNVKPSPSVQKQEQEYDILKEFEDFFKVGQPQQTETKVHSDKEMYEGAKNREDYIPVPEKSFHTTTASEHTFIDPWDVKKKELKKKKKKISPEIEKRASAYEKALLRKDSAATGIIRDINERLRKPSTLKEYIVISEIIGKPKALKR